MNKKIISIALIVFSLIFVSILGTVMITVGYAAKSAETKLVNTLSMGAIVSFQDGDVLSGGIVVSMVNSLSLIENKDCEALVITGENPDGQLYSSTDKYGDGTNSMDNNYINKKGTFTLEVIKNANGSVTQLKFKQLIE